MPKWRYGCGLRIWMCLYCMYDSFKSYKTSIKSVLSLQYWLHPLDLVKSGENHFRFIRFTYVNMWEGDREIERKENKATTTTTTTKVAEKKSYKKWKDVGATVGFLFLCLHYTTTL